MSLAEPSGTRRGGGGTTAKAFVGQIYAALHSSLRSNPIINGVDCSRLWIQVALTFLFLVGYILMVPVSGQGVVVSTSSNLKQCTVDDGTGVLRLELQVFLKNSPPGANAQPQLGQWNDTTSSYVLSAVLFVVNTLWQFVRCARLGQRFMIPCAHYWRIRLFSWMPRCNANQSGFSR
ncbi:hypothetical protein PsorP6_000647 [Peronosclerospora sorghi]|uniref:Uncharacterized protein n=1 Tax=Peronosclerospora sorghi TaxID=230839 RepID=A0ACC0WWP7_9STRA|nr:hypothetical protein PsorP6_000647 [Peronosclerospora sorghi]